MNRRRRDQLVTFTVLSAVIVLLAVGIVLAFAVDAAACRPMRGHESACDAVHDQWQQPLPQAPTEHRKGKPEPRGKESQGRGPSSGSAPVPAAPTPTTGAGDLAVTG